MTECFFLSGHHPHVSAPYQPNKKAEGLIIMDDNVALLETHFRNLSSLVAKDFQDQTLYKLHEKVDDNLAVDIAALCIDGSHLVNLPLQPNVSS